MDFSSYKIWRNLILLAIGLFLLSPMIFSDDDSVENYYSYNDAGGNRVVINLEEDGTGTIRMEYAKTSSGLEEYMSKDPIACSWRNYSGLGYIQIKSRQGNIYIRDGWAYFSTQDVESKDYTRGCKLN